MVTSAPNSRPWGMAAADLGGTRMRVAVFDEAGEIVHAVRTDTPTDDDTSLARTIAQAIDDSGYDVRGAVVGIAGPVSYRTSEVLDLPNLPGWDPANVSAQYLADQIGLPVLVANDTDLAAVGEHRYGAGKGTLDMLYVTSSTSVGAGVISEGSLLFGRRSVGEAGHMVIERKDGGTVESLGSGKAFKALGLDGKEVTERAQAGDEEAREILRDVADAFGIGVMNLVHAFMPERVVIGGSIAQSSELLLNAVQVRVGSCDCLASEAEVFLATGGDDVGLLGGFALWRDTTIPGAPSHGLTPKQPSSLTAASAGDRGG